MNNNNVDQPTAVGDYACNFCDWKSTDTSRPLSRGANVGCPACEREARFVGTHPLVFRTTKEAMEYAARNRIPTVVPVDVAQPAGAGVECDTKSAFAEGKYIARYPVYVASRASLPERGQMWRDFRALGYSITSSWIDEDGEGATASYEQLWLRITNEIAGSVALVLYAQPDDFPLKGALIEVGIALGMGKPIFVSLPDVIVQARSCRPIGSWVKHPLVTRVDDVSTAMALAASARTPPPDVQQRARRAVGVSLRISTCGACPYVDHSGAFTPGGAQTICGHRDAVDTFAARVEDDDRHHWRHRVVQRDAAPPSQCPLRVADIIAAEFGGGGEIVVDSL